MSEVKIPQKQNTHPYHKNHKNLGIPSFIQNTSYHCQNGENYESYPKNKRKRTKYMMRHSPFQFYSPIRVWRRSLFSRF